MIMPVGYACLFGTPQDAEKRSKLLAYAKSFAGQALAAAKVS